MISLLYGLNFFVFFFKQKTAYEMRISDWSSDVCSSDLPTLRAEIEAFFADAPAETLDTVTDHDKGHGRVEERSVTVSRETDWLTGTRRFPGELRLPGAATIVCVTSRTELKDRCRFDTRRSEEHTSELQSPMRHSYAVFCLKKKTTN